MQEPTDRVKLYWRLERLDFELDQISSAAEMDTAAAELALIKCEMEMLDNAELRQRSVQQ
jgi:hypothetical protein